MNAIPSLPSASFGVSPRSTVKTFARNVTVRVQGQIISYSDRTLRVTDTVYLSRSRASFLALDELAKTYARDRMELQSVSELLPV